MAMIKIQGIYINPAHVISICRGQFRTVDPMLDVEVAGGNEYAISPDDPNALALLLALDMTAAQMEELGVKVPSVADLVFGGAAKPASSDKPHPEVK